MCIRDSVRGAAVRRRPLFRHLLEPVAAVRAARTQGADMMRCLLYTSDAADERSSVDLGGRRIIKKKTIKQTRQLIRNVRKYQTRQVEIYKSQRSSTATL